MTVVVSAATTGPDPEVHEVVHFGAEICTDDFREVLGTFYAYVQAERPEAAQPGYLARAGFASAEQLSERGEYYRPAPEVWSSFARTLLRYDAQHAVVSPAPSPSTRALWAERGVGAGGADLPTVLARTRVACFNAPLEAPFLGASMRRNGFEVDFEQVRQTTGLCGLMLDYTTGLRYIGFVREPSFDFEGALAFFGVTCRRPTDPVYRAGAVRQAYAAHYSNLKAIYDSAAKWEGHSRRRRGSG